MPMSRRGPVTGLPASTTLPEDGGSSPAMIFSSVDLPQPLAPITEANSPSRRVRSTLSSACTLRRAKRLADAAQLVDRPRLERRPALARWPPRSFALLFQASTNLLV